MSSPNLYFLVASMLLSSRNLNRSFLLSSRLRMCGLNKGTMVYCILYILEKWVIELAFLWYLCTYSSIPFQAILECHFSFLDLFRKYFVKCFAYLYKDFSSSSCINNTRQVSFSWNFTNILIWLFNFYLPKFTNKMVT